MASLPDESTPSKTWYQSIRREFSRALVNYAELGSYIEPFVQVYQPFWSPGGHRAQIVQVRDENPKVFSLVMKPSRSWPGFQAGQFIEVVTEHDGRRIGRCFSISSSPTSFINHGTIELTIRIQENGLITPRLRQLLKPGQFVGISKPQGDFTLRDSETSLLLIAGGSGITPFRSMLHEASYKTHLQNIKLLYYASNKDLHLFQREFESLTSNHPHIDVTLVSTSRAGRLCAEHLSRYCADYTSRHIYLCGPTGMIQSGLRILQDHQIPKENIFLEHFGSAPIKKPDTETGGRVYFSKSKQSISSSPKTPQSLLTLAEQSGLQPQSGCRMGLCGQCVCTKKNGVVFNTKTGRHSDDRSENIKLCISVPMGDVTLDL